MSAAQNDVCAVCRKAQNDNKVLFVDHDHANGIIRGLLCKRCNSVLGLCNDNQDLLIEMCLYLSKHLSAQAARPKNAKKIPISSRAHASKVKFKPPCDFKIPLQ